MTIDTAKLRARTSDAIDVPWLRAVVIQLCDELDQARNQIEKCHHVLVEVIEERNQARADVLKLRDALKRSDPSGSWGSEELLADTESYEQHR